MISFNKKLLVTSFLLAASLSFSASLSAMNRKLFLSGKNEHPVIQITDKDNAELFEQITNPEEKTYNIRQEIAAFCERPEVQERLNENPTDRHNHNIRDIKAHFSKSVVNPAAFLTALSRAMKPQITTVKALDTQFTIQSLGSDLVTVNAFPLLHKTDTPFLHACIQKLCRTAGVIGKPLIMLIDGENCSGATATSFGKYHPVIEIAKQNGIDELSDQGIEGMLTHEMGHIKNHHSPIPKKILISLTNDAFNKKCLCQENDADDAAIYEFDEAENFVITMQECDDLIHRFFEKNMLDDEDFQKYAQENPEKIKALLNGTTKTGSHPLLKERIEKALTALREKRGF